MFGQLHNDLSEVAFQLLVSDYTWTYFAVRGVSAKSLTVARLSLAGRYTSIVLSDPIYVVGAFSLKRLVSPQRPSFEEAPACLPWSNDYSLEGVSGPNPLGDGCPSTIR